mgnify:CR=1 FL=1
MKFPTQKTSVERDAEKTVIAIGCIAVVLHFLWLVPVLVLLWWAFFRFVV